MKDSPACVLLVPPLSAHGGVPSMTLYWRNLNDALIETKTRWPALKFKAVVPPPGWRASGMRRRIAQRIVMPALIRREARRVADAGNRPLIHILDPHYAHLLPQDGGGSITCHDLDALVSPGSGFAKSEERWRLRQLRRAGAIHAISGNTARDITRYFPAQAERIVINHYGLSSEFRRRPSRAPAVHLAPLHAVAGEILVLHVGSNIERKNIPTLLRGFATTKARLPGVRLKLVKVGNALEADGFAPLLAELGIAGDLIHLGSLNVEQLVDVYNACTLFAFPSRYEGFGRPVVEAQACGLPCVLADSSSLPEVGGTAALYHPTDNAAKMADRMVDLITKAELREQAVAAGIANAGRFTWRRHAEAVVASLLRLNGCPDSPPQSVLA